MAAKKTETCKTCVNCKQSYRSGWCDLKQKKVKYTATCEDWRKK